MVDVLPLREGNCSRRDETAAVLMSGSTGHGGVVVAVMDDTGSEGGVAVGDTEVAE